MNSRKIFKGGLFVFSAVLISTCLVFSGGLKAMIDEEDPVNLSDDNDIGIIVSDPTDDFHFSDDGRVYVIVALSETPLRLRSFKRYPDSEIPALGLPALMAYVRQLDIPKAKKESNISCF